MQALVHNTAGADLTNKTEGRATFILSPPMDIPQGSKVCCSRLSYVNYFINISAALGNNKLYLVDTSGPTGYTITIPDGAYIFDELNTFLIQEQISGSMGTSVFELLATYATGKVSILFDGTNTGWYIDFTGANSCYEILGFLVTDQPGYNAGAGASAKEVVTATNQGEFVVVSDVRLLTNLSATGYSNKTQGQILISSTPTVPPGSTEQYEPQNLIWLPCVAGKYSKIDLQLVDQNGKGIDYTADFYGCTILIDRV